MWLPRIEHHCHINGIKFWQLNGIGDDQRLLETMEITNDIGIKEGKCFENLLLFSFILSISFMHIGIFSQAFKSCHLFNLAISLLKYFIFKVVYVHMFYAWVWPVMCVLWRVFLFLPSCNFFELLKKFKVFCFSKLLKASPSALLQASCSFLHSRSSKNLLTTQFATSHHYYKMWVQFTSPIIASPLGLFH
jgi:hypothetical protein